jgi:RNA recognition motif-containing protein
MFKIFVGNLNPTTTEEAVRRLFSRHAEIEDVALPMDPETGKPRGFAIVMIRDEMRAKGAMIALRGTRLDGRALVINQAYKKGKAPPKRPRRSANRLLARGKLPRGGDRPYGGGAGRQGAGGSGSSGGSQGGGPRPGGGYSSRPNRGYGGRPDRPRRDFDDRGNRGPSSPRDQ